jgi:hypothetical protein
LPPPCWRSAGNNPSCVYFFFSPPLLARV